MGDGDGCTHQRSSGGFAGGKGGPDMTDSTPGSAATVTLDREDVEAVVSLVERSIQMLRARWNTMPVNETDAFVRVRAAVDGRAP